MRKILVIVLALLVVIGLVAWKFGPALFAPKKDTNGPVTLTYWGLWEEESLMRPVLDEFQKANPNVKVVFEKKSSTNYRSRLQTQIKEGSGPDVFRIHNSWLPIMGPYLKPAPPEVFSLSEYENNFFEIAKKSFVRDDGKNIMAAPIGIDGLALYVNKEILAGVGVGIPTNWNDFTTSAIKMTVRDANGTIKTAGAAMGSPANVDHWSDILGLLFLQEDIDMANPDPAAANEALKFFTGFILDNGIKTWDTTLPSSTQAFAQGRLAFYIAPSWRAHELRQLNPSLDFEVAPIPQLAERRKGWATFWGEAVSAKSKHPKEAWELVKFLTSKETQKKLYESASKVRLFGEPYSNKENAQEIASDKLVGAFVTQGEIYDNWYLNSNTFDGAGGGINDEMIKYFEDGVNEILGGKSTDIAMDEINKGVKQILERYGLLKTATPAPK